MILIKMIYFIMANILFCLLIACDSSISTTPTFTQTVDTVEQEIRYTSTYTMPVDSSKWTIDSVYNEALEGLTKYQYHRTLSSASVVESYAYQRNWSANNAVIPPYTHQYTSTWSIDSTVNYRDGSSPLHAFSTIQATVLSPKKLTYATLAPAFQRIYDELRLQISFYTPQLPDYTPINGNNRSLIRFSLRQTSSDGEKMNYGNLNFLEQDAIWLPHEQLVLPLDLNISSNIIPHTITTLIFKDSFPKVLIDTLQ